MGMQIWPEGIVLVELPGGPETVEEPDNIIRHVQDDGDCDVVPDFNSVTILTSGSLALLLRLRDMLASWGRRFVLCLAEQATRSIIPSKALDGVRDGEEEGTDALTAVMALPNDPTIICSDSP